MLIEIKGGGWGNGIKVSTVDRVGPLYVIRTLLPLYK